MTNSKHQPLNLMSQRIAAATGRHGPPPRKLLELAARGAIPAELINGRWFFVDDGVAVAAAIHVLGLTTAPPAGPLAA